MRQDGGQEFHGDPLVTESLVLIGTDSSGVGLLYAFDRATGDIQWKNPITSGTPGGVGFTTDLLGHGSSVIAGAFGDYLASFDLSTGVINWEFRSSFSSNETIFPSSPALLGETVYFGGHDGWLYALDVSTGTPRWKRDFGSRVNTAVVTGNGHLNFGTVDRRFHKVDPVAGETVASITLEEVPAFKPLTSAGHVFVFGRDRVLMALDSDLREVKWSLPEPSDWDSPRPFIWRGSLIVGTGDGRVLALDPYDGSVRWSHALGKGRVRGIGSDESSLYVGTIRGHVAAIRLK